MIWSTLLLIFLQFTRVMGASYASKYIEGYVRRIVWCIIAQFNADSRSQSSIKYYYKYRMVGP